MNKSLPTIILNASQEEKIKELLIENTKITDSNGLTNLQKALESGEFLINPEDTNREEEK